MINEERVEKAVEYLRDTAEEYGQLCGQVELYAHLIKQHKAGAFLDVTGTVAEREAKSHQFDTVKESAESHSNAVAEKMTLMAKRKAAELTIDVWRSQNASSRAKTL